MGSLLPRLRGWSGKVIEEHDREEAERWRPLDLIFLVAPIYRQHCNIDTCAAIKSRTDV